MPLSEQRKSLFPQTSDTWLSIARRELKDLSEDQAVSALQSWNLHVFMRPSTPANTEPANTGAVNTGSTGASEIPVHTILPSDIIFLEAPLVNMPLAKGKSPA